MADNGKELIQKEIFPEPESVDTPSGGFPFIAWLSAAGDLIPPHWSLARDIELRKFWKQSDHLSGTVNTLRDMMVAMPVKAVARNQAIKSHVRDAGIYTDILHNRTESRGNYTTQGWTVGYGAFIEDYHTQDNGGFFVVDGPGRGDEPLQGPPTKLIHLDSGQCWRTQVKEFPIVYTDVDGMQYTLHQSRIISMAGQAAPIAELYGVGFCAVSRAINTAQNLIDIGRYKQEKLGSRPHRGIMAIEGSSGAEREAKNLSMALTATDEAMDNRGLTRYSSLPVVAVKGTLNLVSLADLPDGFNELESVQLGMSVLALAFGVDVRQLAFALGVAGQTKADAEIQHLKMRGKGPGVIIRQVTQQLEAKFLPPHLKLVFDFQDDEQDKLNADIRKMRAERREKDLVNGVTTIRVEREQMVETGELDKEQFIQLELENNRLPDGGDVLGLFQSPDLQIQQLLAGIDDFETTEEDIAEAVKNVRTILMSNANPKLKLKASMVLALLEKLAGEQEPEIVEAELVDEEPEDTLPEKNNE